MWGPEPFHLNALREPHADEEGVTAQSWMPRLAHRRWCRGGCRPEARAARGRRGHRSLRLGFERSRGGDGLDQSPGRRGRTTTEPLCGPGGAGQPHRPRGWGLKTGDAGSPGSGPRAREMRRGLIFRTRHSSHKKSKGISARGNLSPETRISERLFLVPR